MINLKKIVVLLSIHILFSLIFSVYAVHINQSIGVIKLNQQEYTNNLCKQWFVNIGENKTVRLKGDVSTEYGYDLVYIYDVDEYGNPGEQPIASFTGQANVDIITSLPSGKAMVKFVSDEIICGYGFNLFFQPSDSEIDEIYCRYDYSQNLIIMGDFFANDVLALSSLDRSCKMVVKGNIHAEEIIVDIKSPADYVFKQEYKLRNLYEVESFVKKQHHLPDIPSAKTLVEKGFNTGEMQNLMLQKIEELTLYMIQQDKKMDQLESRFEKCKRLEKKMR